MSEEEWLDLTPDKITALSNEYIQEQKILDIRTAVLCRTIIEPYRKESSTPFNPFSHLPFLSMDNSKPVTTKGPVAMEYEEYQNVQKLSRMMGGKGVKHG